MAGASAGSGSTGEAAAAAMGADGGDTGAHSQVPANAAGAGTGVDHENAGADTGTGSRTGAGGHTVPSAAGGHATGFDLNVEPYGVAERSAHDTHATRDAQVADGARDAQGEHEAQATRGVQGADDPSAAAGAEYGPRAAQDASAADGQDAGADLSGASGTQGSSDALRRPEVTDVPEPPEDSDVSASPESPDRPAVPGAAERFATAAVPSAPEMQHGPVVPGEVDEAEAPAPASGAHAAPAADGAHGEHERQGARSGSCAAPRNPAEPGADAAPHGDGETHADPTPHRGSGDRVRTAAGQAYADAEREAVYRTIRERRDVRVGFRPDPVAHDLLTRVLEAAHQAPSVGHAKPWDFLVVDDRALRTRVHDLARAEREGHARSLPGTRAHAFSGLKVEAILEAPLNIAVTVDPTRGPQPSAGRDSRPMSAPYSAALAVENLWLAARAEGLGVGWVSFLDERDVARALDLPPHLDVVAYLCVGHVDEFPTEPELGLGGWAKGRPLSWAVHHDRYGRRGLPGREPTSLLEETIAANGALSARAVEEARDRQSRMSKPPGSLGVLEEVSVRLAGLSGECPPPIPEPAAVAVFAGDHGVHAQGVTPWPQEVTAQMVQTFLSGGAVVNSFAAQVGADVTVVDVGVVADLPPSAGLLPRKVARGTADPTQGPAMTRPQVLQALETGIEVARDMVAAGHRCLITGDMGIANTTPSAALVCAYTGASPEDATGVGTGADEAAHRHKVDVVRRALEANPVDASDPVGTLAALGGLEHAALAGFVLGGAATRVPVLLDGVIAGSAALAAAAISPESVSACFAGHRSSEPGHAVALDHLGLRPLVDLEMRLGEGSGALLALPMLQASARALRSVATFEDSGITAAQ
uniref:nicotinate-nucleotide--dimethylbenzimidazole phosphoribosyltransferase n=1 Tax=Nocardiopsis salina TaxID=245836 RepID=UPI001EF9E50C|nr:nicotinate-nucleotide--dimethylbenzimidazole phosphoribosyltransferase [Nocardiopsis salina]